MAPLPPSAAAALEAAAPPTSVELELDAAAQQRRGVAHPPPRATVDVSLSLKVLSVGSEFEYQFGSIGRDYRVN